MKRALLAVLLLPAPGRAQSVPGVCVSNCDIPTYQSSGSSYEYGAPSVSWGRMTGRATDQVKECGSKPLCILLRASIAYPIAFVFDVPYYAVKGVGYGLLYGAKGVGKAGKAIGRGVAYPFRDRPQQPPASWEAYKHQILKRQKKLAKQGPLQKETARWCKGHVPLSHGPSRAEWEGRCNPGDIVPRASLPESVRFPNAGETMPMGLPPDSPQAGAASAMAPAPVAAAAAPAAPMASAPGPASATPVLAPAAEASAPSAPAASASAPPATAAPAASPAAQTPPSVAAAAPPAPSDGGPGIPPALPASARPETRDVNEVLKQGEEPAKDAANGGFDSREPMPGAKQKEVVAAFSATAAQGPRDQPDYQAAIAALSKETGASPAPAGTSLGPGAGPSGYGPGGSVPTVAAPATPASAPLPAIPAHPLVAEGLARLIGDPDRFRAVYAPQSGNTCAQAVGRQLLSEMGVQRTEDELFYKTLEKGWYSVSKICSGSSSTRCHVRYDAATGTCSLYDSSGTPGRLPDTATCAAARMIGFTRYSGIPALYGAVSGKAWNSRLFTAPPKTPAKKVLELKRGELPRARDEVLAALRSGKAVGISVKEDVWRGSYMDGLHIITVTAAVERDDGTIEGFYVNDSGSNDYGLFVPLDKLQRAWLADDLHRVYRQ